MAKGNRGLSPVTSPTSGQVIPNSTTIEMSGHSKPHDDPSVKPQASASESRSKRSAGQKSSEGSPTALPGTPEQHGGNSDTAARTPNTWTEVEILAASTKWLKERSASNFLSMYIEKPGRCAEIFGPDSEEAYECMAWLDSLLGKLMEIFKSTGEDINVMIAGTPPYVKIALNNKKTLIDLQDLSSKFLAIGSSPVLQIKPLEDGITLYESIKSKNTNNQFSVYIKMNLPEEWHYDDRSLVQPIVLVANEGSVFSWDFFTHAKELCRMGNRTCDFTNDFGSTGYDNRLKSMKTIFIGTGPAFQNSDQGQQRKPPGPLKGPHLVDVFSLMCHILGIKEPATSKGDIRRMSQVLRYSPEDPLSSIHEIYDYATRPQNLPMSLAIVAGTFVFLMCIVASLALVIRRRRKSGSESSYRYTQVKIKRRNDVMDPEEDKERLLERTNLANLPEEA